MRIISGKHKGRKLQPPANIPARPTTDFAKTGLFNIIHNRYNIGELKVLDLYAGTGAIGLEFLSRGAREVVFIEKDQKCSKFIERTLEELSFNQGHVIPVDVEKYISTSSSRFDIIFADPPYALCDPNRLIFLIKKHGLLEEEGLLVIEHAKDLASLTENLGAEVRSYGGSSFSFFQY